MIILLVLILVADIIQILLLVRNSQSNKSLYKRTKPLHPAPHSRTRVTGSPLGVASEPQSLLDATQSSLDTLENLDDDDFAELDNLK